LRDALQHERRVEAIDQQNTRAAKALKELSGASACSTPAAVVVHAEAA